MSSPLLRYSGLALGVAVMSCAAILIRLADAPSLVIATYRLSLATALALPVTLIWSGDEVKRLTGNLWGWSVLSGLLLAVHFAAWISSLAYTSVASSVALVTASPIFVGVASHFWLGERLSRTMLAGIAASVAGGMTIAYGDVEVGQRALFGDALAVAGALTMGAYLMVGRKVRGQVSLLPYITVVYGSAALALAAMAAGAGHAFTGYAPATWVMFLALAVGPQLLGHSSLNWALRYLPATVISVTTLAEPVGSTALAYLILDERVTPVRAIGGALVLAGIYLVIRSQERSHAGSPVHRSC